MIVAVIGGGASGMMAALWACKKKENHVIIFERQARLGRKLMATGNGRCNLSNRYTDVSHYHGTDPDFVIPALNSFSVSDTLDFFSTLGLLTVDEPDGKIYPFSNQSNSVADVLRLALELESCEIKLGCEVQSVTRCNKKFKISYSGGEDYADRVIVACGGMAGGHLGGTGSGYTILKSFGHHCTKLYPSLVQLRTDRTWVKSLKGIRCSAVVVLKYNGKQIARESGEVQFTDFGISGPCVFALARSCAGLINGLEAVINLCPCLTKRELIIRLEERKNRFKKLTLDNYLTGLLHNRIGRTILRSCGLNLEKTIDTLSDSEIDCIAKAIQQFTIPVLGLMDLQQAQVTAGGIMTSEFDSQTMESLIVPGLYATGEVLDIDGDCGGFNLQWAWSSGHLAGLQQSHLEV